MTGKKNIPSSTEDEHIKRDRPNSVECAARRVRMRASRTEFKRDISQRVYNLVENGYTVTDGYGTNIMHLMLILDMYIK